MARPWRVVRMDASKREHEAAVSRLEGLHRESARLERDAVSRREEVDTERAAFRKELNKVGWCTLAPG